jgi:hypothetical protein
MHFLYSCVHLVASAGGQRMKYGAMCTPGVSITKASEGMPGWMDSGRDGMDGRVDGITILEVVFF